MISTIDIALIVGLLAFALHGFSKGLVSKLLSLAAIVAGIIIAAKYLKEISLWVRGFIGGSEMVSGIVGTVIVFAVLLLIASLLTKLFKSISILQLWDKIGGAIFGLLEGALILSILLLVLSIFNIPAVGPSLDRSFMYDPVRGFASTIYTTFVQQGATDKVIDDFFSKGSVGRNSRD